MKRKYSCTYCHNSQFPTENLTMKPPGWLLGVEFREHFRRGNNRVLSRVLCSHSYWVPLRTIRQYERLNGVFFRPSGLSIYLFRVPLRESLLSLCPSRLGHNVTWGRCPLVSVLVTFLVDRLRSGVTSQCTFILPITKFRDSKSHKRGVLSIFFVNKNFINILSIFLSFVFDLKVGLYLYITSPSVTFIT